MNQATKSRREGYNVTNVAGEKKKTQNAPFIMRILNFSFFELKNCCKGDVRENGAFTARKVTDKLAALILTASQFCADRPADDAMNPAELKNVMEYIE